MLSEGAVDLRVVLVDRHEIVQLTPLDQLLHVSTTGAPSFWRERFALHDQTKRSFAGATGPNRDAHDAVIRHAIRTR